MILTSLNFTVSGNSHEELLGKVKTYLSEFFDINLEDIEKKINIEIKIQDQTESVEFSEDDYSAYVIAQVKNV